MGAALRLTNGWTGISRAWRWDSDSPLYGRDKTYQIWCLIIEQCGYVGCKGLEVGHCLLTAIDIARYFRLNPSTVSRALEYLEAQNLITRERQGRHRLIKLPSYEMLTDISLYFEHYKPKPAQVAPEPPLDEVQYGFGNATVVHDANGEYHYEIDVPSKSQCNYRFFNATVSYGQVDVISGCNNWDIGKSETEKKTPMQLSGDIVRELSITNKNIIPATQLQASVTERGTACVKSDRHQDRHQDTETAERNQKKPHPDDCEDMDMVSIGEPSEFDFEIAKEWAAGIAEVDVERSGEGRAPKRRLNIEAGAQVVRMLREVDGLTEYEIEQMTIHRFDDPFYRYSNMWLGNLRKRAANGLRKSDNLLALAMKARQARKAQQVNSDDLGEVYYGRFE